MRLHVLSDLHLEFGPFDIPQVEADVLVLAGDLDRGKRGLTWAERIAGERPVVYVAGNHEHYGHALPKLTTDLRAVATVPVHYLEQEWAEIGGVRFFGCTLWTDFELLERSFVARDTAQLRLNDYRKIRVSPQYRRLRTSDTMSIHYQSRRWLEGAVERGETRGAVIVSHHAPSAQSLPPGWEGDWLAPAYASDLEALIEASGAALWIHGHTHRPVDYRVGDTRVISNPRGYPDEPARGFVPSLVVEL